MSQVFNLYCDESCHLENDHQPVMVLGTVWCLQEKARETAVRLREIKTAHGLPSDFELKWTKVSPAKLGFYMEVLNYFFDDDDLHFRAWVAHKAGLRHADFGQTHADWYYKMMFGLMEPLLTPEARFRLYLDKKDTRSARKVAKLHDVLCNKGGDVLAFHFRGRDRGRPADRHAPVRAHPLAAPDDGGVSRPPTSGG